MILDSYFNSKELTPKFKVDQIVNARNRLWRIERMISQKLEYDRNSEINLLEVLSIDVVPNRCCPLLNNVKKINGNVEIKSLEDIKLAKIPKPVINKLRNPDFQKVLIQVMRFDLIFGTSSFISLTNSRVIPVSYQLVPVLMAMAQEKVRLLIADDVGLGKIIEAGLIIQEYILMTELDVIFALMYRFTQFKLECNLDTFYVLRDKELDEYGEYKTKKLVLKAYNKFNSNHELGSLFRLEGVDLEKLKGA